ncbi:hypothetical protein [Bacteroides sp.]|uniref:hypothetical protein n=1 Tax=Bacteroides sp. TaxID=29523 RepID=UPI00261A135B|nr:hypothetical protein [Bacteroides sp.]MDD3040275.1 hypothetical protein [Bacteroides sp.]
MSKYYQINGLKVRVSDHEPNTGLRGSSDIYLYVKSACNELLSIEAQLEAICDKKGYNMSDFRTIINDWKDGTYGIHTFEDVVEEVENDAACSVVPELIASYRESNDEKLKGYSLSKFAKHPEIKALSEETGVSQSYIKKYFNIR